MSKVLTSSNRFLMRGGRWLTREDSPVPPPPLRRVILHSIQGCTLHADPMTGYDGDVVTLSCHLLDDYTLDRYYVSGATLYDGNKFIFNGSDVDVTVSVTWHQPRYVYLNQTTGGTISANPMSGHDGDTVTLSNTPSTNYTFNGYSVTGATLYSGNKFNFSGSDVTCSASWTYIPPQPTWVELVNREGDEWTVPPGNGITVYIGDKMAGGTSYRYVTLKGDVKFNPPGTGSNPRNMEYSLTTLQDDYMYWRVRWTRDSNYIGAVGIYGGVTGFTPASSTVRSFVSDGITYYYKTSWTRSSDVFKNVKQVYDTQNNTCELYIDDTLWGTATVNYSPHSIYGARIGYKYGEEGDERGLRLKNLKAAAFQNLADARAY